MLKDYLATNKACGVNVWSIASYLASTFALTSSYISLLAIANTEPVVISRARSLVFGGCLYFNWIHTQLHMLHS